MAVRPLSLGILLVLALVSTLSDAARRVDLDYHVRLLPDQDQAEVQIILADGAAVRGFDFNLGQREIYSDFEADGEWIQETPGRGTWLPAPGKARLAYRVKISRERKDGRYDARMTDKWALFRGDNLVPAANLDNVDGIDLVSRLTFELPEGWKSVETGWPRVGKNRFRIDNPSRLFDRPTGWMLAGQLGTRRVKLGETQVTIAAPVGEGVRRMDMLTLLTFVWPQVQNVFLRDPPKLLVVSAGDPMWRGGLSAANSLYMHADRPLVSENGTSSLVHEVVHVFSRIRDTDRSDWISEGLAEYYAIELVRRAGGMTEPRYLQLRERLVKWSRSVDSLRTEDSTGKITARAVILLQDLDREIRNRTKGNHSLDDISRGLMRLDRVSTQDFIEITETLLGGASKTLDTKLLR
ncbi:hypothetical protein [Stutzerimonas azotifigens]|uniref:Peptidase M61 catalytic domain-containing protein n=1 Tax=Stutzerimonas azotifigens TaxID=291995 RepID=A0ABR5YXF1_9GAMM|nr:hypothetical protein [Stutzerimonas azotifigens]MBA1272611.1 hypothetical protein [Stutzerimonas azotifigens]